MLHNPKQIEFAENLIIKLFPEQFTRPLPNIDRQTVEYLCNNYQNLKFRRILKAVELAWSENLVPGSFFTTKPRPVIQTVSQPSPIGRLVQPNQTPSSPNPFIPSQQNIATQSVQINITPNGKTPRAKRSAPSSGPQTCAALFKKRKEQIENSTKQNTSNPDRFLIPHQTPQQLSKTQQVTVNTNSSPVLAKKKTNISDNMKDKPLSMASLPPDLRQNLEKNLNSHLNNTAPKMSSSPKVAASTNESSSNNSILTIDVNQPGPSGLQSMKAVDKISSAETEKSPTPNVQTKSTPQQAVSKSADDPKPPAAAVVTSNSSPSPKLPDIMDTIAGGKRLSLNINMPSNMDDIRRALGETNNQNSDDAPKTAEVESQPDRTVIDKIIGNRSEKSKSDKAKIDSELQNILNDVNGKLETCTSTDSSSTDSGNETNASSTNLPLATRNSTAQEKNKIGTQEKAAEKSTGAGIEISSSIQVLDSDEEDEVQRKRDSVKRNIRRVLAETDGVVTIDDSEDEHSSNEDNNKNPKSKNNNHKSDSNHLDDLLDTDQENGENDQSDEENVPESKPIKNGSRKKRNEARSFVRSGYDVVKSRSRKKSTDVPPVVSHKNKKQKPRTKVIPETIIPPPPSSPEEGINDFAVKKILKTRRSKENGIEYRVRYKGFTKDDDDWVTFDAMEGTEEHKKKLLADYKERKSRKQKN